MSSQVVTEEDGKKVAAMGAEYTKHYEASMEEQGGQRSAAAADAHARLTAALAQVEAGKRDPYSVSVLMAVKNRYQLVSHIARQLSGGGARGVDLELIVADDGSVPPSFPVHAMGSAACSVYLWQQANQHPDGSDAYHKVRGMNRAAMLSSPSSPYLLFLDDDVVPGSPAWALSFAVELEHYSNTQERGKGIGTLVRGEADVIKLSADYKLPANGPATTGSAAGSGGGDGGGDEKVVMAYMDYESYKFMDHFFTTYNCGLHRQLYEAMGGIHPE
jgi:hypothetical protein